MTEQNITEALRGASLFEDTDQEYLNQLAGFATLAEYKAGSIIFHENEPANDVYVVIQGNVDLFICRPDVGCRSLMRVGSGDLLGWSALVGRNRLSDSARALTATTAVKLDGNKLLAMCRENPPFGFSLVYHVAQILSDRLGATRIQLLEMTGHRLPEVALESD